MGVPPGIPFEYSQRQDCPQNIVDQVRNGNADAIVVLGAGRLSSGVPHCHAIQPMNIASQMIEATRATYPELPIVLSGANPTVNAEAVETVDRSCLVTRLELRLTQAEARHAAAAELQRLTEAD